MRTVDNNILKQIGILIAIIFIGVVILWKLAYFIPGFLGAAAIYIMFRSWYFKVIARRGWKPWLASLTIIVGLLVAFVLPAFLLGQALAPKFNDLIANSDQVKESILKTFAYLQEKFPQITITREQILAYAQRALGFVPSIFNGMAHLFANIFTALFIAYFMFVGGRQLEQGVKKNMPLERASRQEVWAETKNLVISNAVGIPVLALAQGLIALLGYWVCGVEGAVLWGLLTGLATVIPVIGTMIVWVPICIYLFAIGKPEYGIGLALYCLIIVGLADNVIRFLFLKRFGDVHPLITVFGVILGLNIFGMVGLIFGPLLMSYFLLLIKIYQVEFGDEKK